MHFIKVFINATYATLVSTPISGQLSPKMPSKSNKKLTCNSCKALGHGTSRSSLCANNKNKKYLENINMSNLDLLPESSSTPFSSNSFVCAWFKYL